MNRMAQDRSNRVVDIDAGHLTIRDCLVSREEIADYLGIEIPDWDVLGLDPDRVYPLYRPASELAKAAPSWEGKPLLLQHRKQVAQDHDADVVVGVMSNLSWQAPELRADLTVWPQEAIQVIESGEQKELSLGYFYEAVMQPCTFGGQQAAGRMTNLRGNHAALVTNARCVGAMVGDSAIQLTRAYVKPNNERAKAMYVEAAVREMQAIREAEIAVAPYAGAVMGLDSAAKVYREGLKALGVDTRGLNLHDQSMMKAFDMCRRGVRAGGRARPIAQDAASATRRAVTFPNGNRLNRSFA